MTVTELRKMLKGVPGHIRVYVDTGSVLGGFHFVEACTCESGMVVFPEPDESQGNFSEAGEGFILLPHGSTVTEDELEEEDTEPDPQMN